MFHLLFIGLQPHETLKEPVQGSLTRRMVEKGSKCNKCVSAISVIQLVHANGTIFKACQHSLVRLVKAMVELGLQMVAFPVHHVCYLERSMAMATLHDG